MYGFLNLSRFSGRFDDHLGMRDIVMALRWVNKAIECFGGDPGNVTVFGESAGGGAVSALLLIDEAAPLFHKAIIQSNCFDSFYTVEEEEELCEKYLSCAGIDKNNAEGLLSLSTRQLLDAAAALYDYAQFDYYFGRCTFCPVVDGSFLRDFPTLAKFDSLKKPILVGSNRNEGNFLVFSYKWSKEDAKRLAPKALRRLSPEQRDAILSFYPGLPGKPAFGAFLTEIMYALPKILFASHASRGKSEVYVYRYDYATPIMKLMGLKACHVAEMLPLFEISAKPFRTLYLGSEKTIRAIGSRMRRYWGAFARAGKPNAPGLVEWKPYTESQRSTLVISGKDELIVDAEAEIRERYKGMERILI